MLTVDFVALITFLLAGVASLGTLILVDSERQRGALVAALWIQRGSFFGIWSIMVDAWLTWASDASPLVIFVMTVTLLWFVGLPSVMFPIPKSSEVKNDA